VAQMSCAVDPIFRQCFAHMGSTRSTNPGSRSMFLKKKKKRPMPDAMTTISVATTYATGLPVLILAR